MIRTAMLLVCCGLLVAPGCSQGPSFERSVEQDLKLLGLEIHNAQATSQADLEAKSAGAKKILATNNYVYLAGIDMKRSNDERSEYIVAYHKDTPTKGGYALSGDGSVILYTKETFEAAKKWDPNSKPATPGTETASDKSSEPAAEPSK